eukprot:3326304-Prymnesium_polylepis.3
MRSHVLKRRIVEEPHAPPTHASATAASLWSRTRPTLMPTSIALTRSETSVIIDSRWTYG